MSTIRRATGLEAGSFTDNVKSETQRPKGTYDSPLNSVATLPATELWRIMYAERNKTACFVIMRVKDEQDATKEIMRLGQTIDSLRLVQNNAIDEIKGVSHSLRVDEEATPLSADLRFVAATGVVTVAPCGLLVNDHGAEDRGLNLLRGLFSNEVTVLKRADLR